MHQFVKLIMIVLLSMGTLVADEEVVKKVVYNLTTGDIRQLERRLIGGIVAHTTYYQNKLEELKVRVVIHGDAYKFFMKDLNNTAYAYQPLLVEKKDALAKRLGTLSKQYGVEFFVCEAGVVSRKLNKKAFYPFVWCIMLLSGLSMRKMMGMLIFR